MSLDDKRTELLPPEKLGPVPKTALTADDHAKNNLPDILARWRSLHRAEGALDCGSPLPLSDAPSAVKSARGLAHSKAAVPQNSELARPRTAQSFCVPKADLAAQGYDLSLNRYKEIVHEEVANRPPGEILKNLAALEKEITTGMKALEDMLK